MIRIASVIFLMLSAGISQVHAQEKTEDSVRWGNDPYFDVFLRKSDSPGAVAEITGVNRITYGHGVFTMAALSIDGLAVTVIVNHGLSDQPDRLEVRVSEDFIAIPDHIYIEEDDTGTILIYPAAAM